MCAWAINYNILLNNENMLFTTHLHTQTQKHCERHINEKMTVLINTLKYEVPHWNSLFNIKIQMELNFKGTPTNYPSSPAPFNFFFVFHTNQSKDP
jgi:hypothetical protein